MAAQEQVKMATMKEVQIPEWEHTATRKAAREAGEDGAVRQMPRLSLKNAFDAALPPHRRYLGLSRRWFLWVLLAILVVALILIISLTVGLPRHKHPNLPLPSNTGHFTGDLTYYDTGLGACGETSTSADYIVSVSHYIFDAAGSSTSTGGNSNANPLCGRMIRATRFDSEAGETRSADLKVVDRCTGCQPNDLDTTETVFEHLAAIADGRVDVTWAWLS